MATTRMKTNCCHSDGKRPLMIDKNSGNYQQKVFIIFALSLCLCIGICDGQFGSNPYAPGGNYDRDPRFYSREGVDYNPPNPGDKDYR